MNFDDEMLEKLILDGVVEFAGLDRNGEMLYSFSRDLENKYPEMFSMVMNMHMQDIYQLWELGFLNMDATQFNPTVSISPKALDEEELNKLPPQLRVLIDQIKDAMRDSPGA